MKNLKQTKIMTKEALFQKSFFFLIFLRAKVLKIKRLTQDANLDALDFY